MVSVIDEVRAQILQNTNSIADMTGAVDVLRSSVESAMVAFANYKLMALAFFLITLASFFLAYGLILITLDRIGVINFYREGWKIKISTIVKGEMVEVTRKKKVKKKKKPKKKLFGKKKVKKVKSEKKVKVPDEKVKDMASFEPVRDMPSGEPVNQDESTIEV